MQPETGHNWYYCHRHETWFCSKCDFCIQSLNRIDVIPVYVPAKYDYEGDGSDLHSCTTDKPRLSGLRFWQDARPITKNMVIWIAKRSDPRTWYQEGWSYFESLDEKEKEELMRRWPA